MQMPIPRHFLLNNPKQAVEFLEGREGVCLHPIAHWAFAASQGFGVGHIIIGNQDRPVSAFVPKGDMMSNLPKTYAMVSAAGAVAEHYAPF